MSCCTTQDRHEFILSKVRNMKVWLKDWTSPELAAMYDETKVVGMIASGLMPLYASGKLSEGFDAVMERLVGVPSDQVVSVRAKVERYLTCFCEAMI